MEDKVDVTNVEARYGEIRGDMGRYGWT